LDGSGLKRDEECQFSNSMSSSQFQCHRDVIDDTKVRIWSELECSAASRTELLTSASTTFSAVRCLSHFGFLRARSVAAAEYRLDSAENLRGKLSVEFDLQSLRRDSEHPSRR
jgi:hypothetical protein